MTLIVVVIYLFMTCGFYGFIKYGIADGESPPFWFVFSLALAWPLIVVLGCVFFIARLILISILRVILLIKDLESAIKKYLLLDEINEQNLEIANHIPDIRQKADHKIDKDFIETLKNV